MDELYLLFSFAFGSVVGSFLNVCIHRLPRGESIIRPGSHCPHCRSPIAFYDNVPILSYLILRGRCRSCGGRISPHYPLVEAMGGAGAVAAAIKFGFSPQALIYFALLCSLIVVSFIDLDHMIIPDEISLGGLAVGLALSFLHLLHGPKEALGGALVGGGTLWVVAEGHHLLTRREGMGGGDIKLMAMVGSFLGWKGVIFSIFSGSLFGSIVGLILMRAKGADSKYAIPFGPFLSLGAVCYIFFGKELMAWYKTLLVH